MLIFNKIHIFISCTICAILHEMGHSIVGRKLGYKLNIITLMPYGASLSGENAPFSQNDEIKIAVAGPLVNFILIVLNYTITKIFPSLTNILADFMYANLYTLIFNILPVYPLDGGRIMLAVMSKKLSRVNAYKIVKKCGFVITGFIFLLFFISFFFELNYMLGINALFLLIGLFEEDSNIYYSKLDTFEKFKSPPNGTMILADSNNSIFDVYKEMINKNASKVAIKKNNKLITYSKNDVISKLTNTPLDDKILNL